jgi:hypothetical protein
MLLLDDELADDELELLWELLLDEDDLWRNYALFQLGSKRTLLVAKAARREH